MSAAPMVMSLRVARADHRTIRLWIPLFLLWPLLLVLAVLAFIFTIIADAVLLVADQRYHHYSRLLIGCLRAMGQTRGLTMYIENDDSTVDLSLH